MKYVGIDLHKETFSVCVVDQSRKVLERRRLFCREVLSIKSWFQSLGPFAAMVEAAASDEWLLKPLEPLAEKLALAHPRKLRVIAETTRKSDRLDAQTPAEFLASDHWHGSCAGDWTRSDSWMSSLRLQWPAHQF